MESIVFPLSIFMKKQKMLSLSELVGLAGQSVILIRFICLYLFFHSTYRSTSAKCQCCDRSWIAGKQARHCPCPLGADVTFMIIKGVVKDYFCRASHLVIHG